MSINTSNNTFIDPLINNQLITELINFWWPNSDFDSESAFDFWFDKTPDAYIKTKYQYLVDSKELADWFEIFDLYNDNNQTITKNGCLTKLVLLLIGDQFTRNIYRDNSDLINYKKHDDLCLKLALAMIGQEEDLLLNLNMRYFILLPLRHQANNQNNTELLEIVRNRILLYIDSYVNVNKTVPQSLIKFYAHTIKNYTNMTDSINFVKGIETSIIEKHNIVEQTDHDILDENCKYWFDKHMLVVKGVEANLSHNQIHIIYQTLINWLKINNFKRIGISLSGGVDSMVILSCFAIIKNYHPELLEKIVAVHVEHSNRIDTAKTERNFLTKYCHNLGVDFYYRSINYMNRTTPYLDRNIYEDESKKLRFNLYKYICTKENLVGICIGHHMGDITENVFTNIIKGRINSDLGQMKQSDVQFDCPIYRPLLGLIKDNIFDFAHTYCVPYFKNSTPSWSCRGVIRDKMIPILKAQFGDFEPNIINFMNVFKEMSELNNKFVIQPYVKSIIKLTFGYKIPFIKEMILDIIWDQILMEITHSNGYHMVSTKSKNNLINWLKGIERNQQMMPYEAYTTYKLSKEYIVYYEKENNSIYIINCDKLVKSNVIQEYKNNLIKIVNGKQIAMPITLDMILNDLALNDSVLNNSVSNELFIPKKQIKLPHVIKQMLFTDKN